MTQESEKLKKYISRLPILGLVGIVSGAFFTVLLFQTKDYWAINSLSYKLLGIILAYIFVNHFAPGGNVNFYFIAHDQTPEEKKLDDLIIKYRSKFLIVFAALLYFITNIGTALVSHPFVNKNINFDEIFGSIFVVFIIVGALLGGIKYISAWWNIRKHREELGL